MKKPIRFCLLKTVLIFFLLFEFSMAQAQTIAAWNYEPLLGTLSNPTSNSGAGNGGLGFGTSAAVVGGSASLIVGTRIGMTGTGCGTQNGVTAWAFEPFDPGTVNEVSGAKYSVSTMGYQNISVTWDQRWSNTAPNTVRLQYTINGLTWINFNMTAANTTFCLGSLNANGCFEVVPPGDIFTRIAVNLSAIPGINNNPNFAVRMVASYYQATGQFRQTTNPTLPAGVAGTWRFDNVAISGTLLPGPTGSVISNSGATSFCAGSGPVNIKVTITGGTGPFTVSYSDGTTTFVVNNYLSGTDIPVNPTSTKSYTIVSVVNANGVIGSANSGSPTVTVNALPGVPGSANVTTCLTTAVTLTGTPSGGTWSIPNPYSGPSTTFTYTVTSAAGCPRTSATYTFTRNVSPTITAQPSITPQTVCQGSAFAPITVTATGTATLTYQWYRNTTASTTGGTALSGILYLAEIANGSKTDTYTPLSNTIGTYYYYVVVTNSCLSVKSTAVPAAFTVVAPSVAGTISASQIVCAGGFPSDLTLSGQTGAVVKWQRALDAGFTIGVTDIVNTTNTLSGAAIGMLSQTIYIRAFVKNGPCTGVATVEVQLQVKSTTWAGSWSNGVPDSATSAIFAGDYSSTGNLNACAVIVNSGNVVFNPNDILSVQNGVTVTGGTLTFENNSSLIQVNSTANSGSITYKRDSTPVRRYDYTYWSSPVNAQILATFSPLTLSDKYYWWNTATYNWNSIAAPGITIMDIGKGYIIRAPQPFDPVATAVFYGSFIGTPNNGDYVVPIEVSSASNNLNLIGNPYPSAISADAFMSDSANSASLGTGTSIYFWTHNTPITAYNYTGNDYATYNYTGGAGTAAASGTNTNVPNGYIAAGQSFMIKGLATGTATFKNTMRSTVNNSQFFRPTIQNTADSLEKNRIWLELKNEAGAYKQTLIGYIQNATDGLDGGFDSEVIEAGNPVSLYSIMNNSKLIIQGKGLPFDILDQIPLGFRTMIAGNFEITLANFDGLFESQNIYLEDKMLNIIHDLKQTSYSFTTEAGSFDTRFSIRYTNATLGNTNNIQTSNNLIAYKSGSEIFVNSGKTLMQEIKVFDITGRLVVKTDDIRATNCKINAGSISEMLLVQIKTIDGLIFYKKILN